MTEPNAEDPLEELFARQPLERVPESVYERLQSRAAWNRPSRWSGPLLFASLALLAALLGSLLLVFPQTGRMSDHPEQHAPTLPPAASAPVIALAFPVGEGRSGDDEIRDIGGLSSRFTPKEPPFLADFGPIIDAEASRRESAAL
jgi:hypothetical protein